VSYLKLLITSENITSTSTVVIARPRPRDDKTHDFATQLKELVASDLLLGLESNGQC
jgi:hypothetical protein